MLTTLPGVFFVPTVPEHQDMAKSKVRQQKPGDSRNQENLGNAETWEGRRDKAS